MNARAHEVQRRRMGSTLAEAVDNYLALLVVEGKSPHTIRWYQRKLRAFLKFLADRGEEHLMIHKLSVDHARDFIRFLMERSSKYPDHPHHREVAGGLSPTTINGFARSLRAFSSWLQEDGYTQANVLRPLKPPKVPKTLIKPLSEDELRKILLAIPYDSPEGARNLAIVMMFCDTGVRLSELTDLKMQDFDAGLGECKVFGKGAEERIVPIGYAAKRSVIRYIERFRPEPLNPREDRLFLTADGRPLSRNAVGQMVARLKRRTGIPRLHPHLFRHTFAVRYLVNGGDVFSLQRILGHKSLEMTRRYIALANTDIKDRHRQYSPMDNLGLAIGGRGRPRHRR
ncbi:MAG TPA: hypothetical protein ENL35_00005 [Chloroflexi bacterium]|nr:hypothetical protein [Chloroflexota bacterium]